MYARQVIKNLYEIFMKQIKRKRINQFYFFIFLISSLII